MDDLKPSLVARVSFEGVSFEGAGFDKVGQAAGDGVLPLDHNPYLRPWAAPTPNNVAGKGKIEVPGQMINIVWQNRAAAPTPFETALGDALEQAFEGGADTAEQVVQALNEAGFRGRDGARWTVASFEAELANLGA